LISARFHIELPANKFRIQPWKIILGILASCIFPLFSGCQLLPVQTQPEAAVTTIQTEPVAGAHNAVAPDFNILGRIAIQDENQSFSGSFRWQHLAASDEILLFTPLGQAVAEISKDHEGVRLITSKLEAFYRCGKLDGRNSRLALAAQWFAVLDTGHALARKRVAKGFRS